LLYTVDPKTGEAVEQLTGDSVIKRFDGRRALVDAARVNPQVSDFA